MLKLTLDTLDGLDPAQQGLYAQGDDGKFHLDAEGISEIQAALKKANKEAADRRNALKNYEGVDPEEFRRLKQEAEERAAKDAEAKGEWDKLKEQIVSKHQAELVSKEQRIQALQGALESHLIDARATAAIVAAKGVPQLLLPHVKSRLRVVEAEGKFDVQVLDASGGQLIADAKGTPAGIADLVESFKADPIYGRAFEASGASGGGTQPGGGGSAPKKSMARSAFSQLSPADQMAHVKAGGVVTE